MSRGPVLIMAGGTGGHVFPALAVAKQLLAQGQEVVWLGTKAGLEAEVIPKEGIAIEWITVAPIRGKGLAKRLGFPFSVLRAVAQAWKILKRLKPSVVLGMGGFASGPGGIASWLQGRPLLVHEQNAVAGMTNRWLSVFAKRCFEAFPNSFTRVEATCIGNPLRQSFLQAAACHESRGSDTASKKPKLLVLGGSQGAKKLNDVLPQVCVEIEKTYGIAIEVKHQSGKSKWEVTQAAYQALEFSAQVLPFIDDMQQAYSWADIVICRAGALTLAELAVSGSASILVPYPFAADQHQLKNAEYFEHHGAAIVIEEKDLCTDRLTKELVTLLSKRQRLQSLSQAALKLAKPDATQILTDACLSYVGGSAS